MSQYKGHRVVENPGAAVIKAGITAQYPGVCAKCLGPIAVGQQISSNPSGGWYHVVCPTPKLRGVDVPVETTSNGHGIPEGLPNGVWTIEGPRGHRTFRISTVLPVKAPQALEYSPASQGDKSFREKHAGKRVLELLVGPDNTASYKGLAWVDAGRDLSNAPKSCLGNLWKFGKANEVLVNTFAKLVERGEPLEGYTVHFARHCYKCNRLLTTPESIERGIGPICAGGGWD